ncbi:HAMP domain-containing histidine kinase [Mariprofundus erugo]|uniref:ATP-binding protein n=1 Tax=Mariprofundus erugo TaxID=2528639 RepID=UPI0010FCF452|nr:ATP-binding protein [Mariprofundus erugo]TLS77815.1 HAMP domain-containing histidine kinase [Mariprofundus erugo]
MILFRSLVIGVELMVLVLAIYMLNVQLPVLDVLVMIGLYVAFNLYAWHCLRQGKLSSERQFFIHLSVDVLMLAVLFYFSGGSSNPFVSLFLLPLVIVATILPKPYVWAMSLIVLGCYTLLMVLYIPLHGGANMSHIHVVPATSGFGLHVLGMWFSFLFGVSVILFFVATMAEALRQRDRKLAEAREKYLRDEHVIALGTMAAGAAHELGTPLGTMAVLTKEMVSEYAGQPELLSQIEILRSQVSRCKLALGQLSASAGQLRAESGRGESVAPYLRNLFSLWQEVHPLTPVAVEMSDTGSSPMIVVDETLKQAIMNLLNNAAEASPSAIAVTASWTEAELRLVIRDFGAGFSDDVMKGMGTPFFTTKQNGHGLGFYLAQAVVSRFGGAVELMNHPEGGACITVLLPLHELKVG